MGFSWPTRAWPVLWLAAALCLSSTVQAAGEGGIRISGGFRITSYSEPEKEFLAAQQIESLVEELPSYPQPPLGGFSPLLAITTSDERTNLEFEWNHELQNSYVGSPLNPPASENFVIGTLDSGSVVDLAAGSSALTLGLTGEYLTPYTMPVGGVGGIVDAAVSQPVGFFAAGLGAIMPNGQLDLSQLKGHTNVSTLVAPDISCESGDTITALVGTPFIAFYTTVINNDNYQAVTISGETFIGPDIQIFQQGDPCIPSMLTYPRHISIALSGAMPLFTTASYYGDMYDFITPEWATLVSMGSPFIPLGGATFFEDVGVLEGEPGPLNPLQTKRLLVDTGAQISVISPGVASDLSLPVEPDFTVDICGVGGLVEDVPGYYIDYVKISASGGALEFSNAPFLVLNLGDSPEGGTLDGILGMNFFWNRNIILEPALSGDSFLHVSDPVPFGYVDFDGDKDVDLEDYAAFASAWQTEFGDARWNPACDVFIDNHVDEHDLAAFMQKWLTNY